MEKTVLFLIPGILEGIGVVALSLAITAAPLKWSKITIMGIIAALLLYFVRLIPNAGGFHLVAGVIIVYVMLAATLTAPASRIFIAVFSSILTVGIVEISIHQFIVKIMQISPDKLMTDNLLWAGLGVFQAMLIILLAVMLSKIMPVKEGVWKI